MQAVVFDHGEHSFMGKTASMLGVSEDVGHFEMVLIRITSVLMVLSFVLVGIAMALMLYRGNDFLDTIAFCVVLLVASIPIATPVVANATMALGSKTLATQGALGGG